jgi:hypothetical protein
MKPLRAQSPYPQGTRVVWLLFVLAALTLPAEAQKLPEAPKPTIKVDGAAEPEKVPEWILWREIFRMATGMVEKSPTEGRAFWAERLHLSSQQIELLISHGSAFFQEESRMDADAKQLVNKSGPVVSNSVRASLRQMQVARENRILAFRDLLRASIGNQAFNRLQSFARLQIAPSITIGALETRR